jgi:hypothetical protein
VAAALLASLLGIGALAGRPLIAPYASSQPKATAQQLPPNAELAAWLSDTEPKAMARLETAVATAEGLLANTNTDAATIGSQLQLGPLDELGRLSEDLRALTPEDPQLRDVHRRLIDAVDTIRSQFLAMVDYKRTRSDEDRQRAESLEQSAKEKLNDFFDGATVMQERVAGGAD